MRLKIIGTKELMDDFNIPPDGYEPKLVNIKRKKSRKKDVNGISKRRNCKTQSFKEGG